MYKLEKSIFKFYGDNPDKWRIRFKFLLDVSKSIVGDREFDEKRFEHLALKAFNFGFILEENDVEEFLKTGTICMK